MSPSRTAVPPRRHSRGRTADGGPNPVDRHVGARIRLRRTLLGLSQESLGGKLGLTFQQLQKYERGTNRVSASRLFDLGRALDVPVSFFFDDMPAAVAAAAPAALAAGHAPAPYGDATGTTRAELDLMRAYGAIATPALRAQVVALAKALATLGTAQAAE